MNKGDAERYITQASRSLFKEHNERASRLSLDVLHRLVNDLRKYVPDEIEMLTDCVFKGYVAYEMALRRCVARILEKGIVTSETEMNNIYANLDNMYIFENGINFVIEADRLSHYQECNPREYGICGHDMLIDVHGKKGYLPMYIKTAEFCEKVVFSDGLFEAHSVSLNCIFGNKNENEVIFDGYFVRCKYPRMYVKTGVHCGKCKYGNKMDLQFEAPNGNRNHREEVCVLSRRNRDECYFESQKMVAVSSIINTIAAVCNQYNNRKKVAMKTVSDRSTAKVACKGIEDNKEHILSMTEYVHAERAKHVYLGGHHASPVEHVRRGCVRHLKDGRIVMVKSTVVNRGKAKAVYKAD